MPTKRHVSLWFPRLAAERLLRLDRALPAGPFVVVADRNGAQVITALNDEASAAGLIPGQPLRDARAMCAELTARPANPVAEAGFLTTLRRWAGKFSPWVAEEAPDGLILDITGCAHLFGGEETLAEEIERECARLGLSVRLGLADTLGAAWALARFAHRGADGGLSGDAIDQEARATRSRAVKRRHWTRGGQPPAVHLAATPPRIAASGATRQAIAPLPVAALRLDPDAVAGLNRVGLRRIEDLLGMPRAGLARRFGRNTVRRLDQALGVEPEPVSPARPPQSFAVKMRLPDPIGLEEDLMGVIDRLLPELQTRLERAGRGARRLRVEFSRTDRTMQWLDLGLARPSADPHRMRPLIALKLSDIEADFGIDQIRMIASVHEPLHAEQHAGHAEAGARVTSRGDGAALDDLMGRIGARLGLESLTRLYPADSHIPEKGGMVVAAAFAPASTEWRAPAAERPLRLWPPEPVMIPDLPRLPESFRWRGRDHGIRAAHGPERIAPEWWLDDPDWRTGLRDYWVVVTDRGERLWLYFAHGAARSPGWFCHGAFA
ncbi:Y-family DNA polymerase [Maritimibacter dapengensis]|uniref:DNA polymerase Y family protein n=1 Tax=Maritimibacter dapengensis TaxID=2836868 RepID=A0ABS6T6R0_9RHOB|nr:DNA polymerase Y family protein [Maritimibacter dapengensis]MBV7380373.1 DNA polymerase Y family protein [Maritimibacter dapengensis]